MGTKNKNRAQDRNRRKTDRDRLDSWKAVANYCNRSVRTVRRWEVEEGMPLHRHRHTKGASVYAYPAELDAWRRGHRESSSHPGAAGRVARNKPRIAYWGSLAATILAAALVGAISARYVTFSSEEADAVLPDEAAAEIVAELPVDGSIVQPLVVAWAEGRLHEVLLQSDALRRQLPDLPPESQSDIVNYLVDITLAMGRLDEARTIAGAVADVDLRNEVEARILFAAGSEEELRGHLEEQASYRQDSTPLFLSMAGLTAEAIDLNNKLGSAQARAGQTDVILGIAEMQAGQPTLAKRRFRAATMELEISDRGYYFVALDMLSRIQKSEGQLVDAIGTLERTMVRADLAASNNAGLFWMMCQRQLAVLYRDAGREAEAVKIENSLRDRLVLSDDEFPLSRNLGVG